MTNQCQHGHLARVCEMCERDNEIQRLQGGRLLYTREQMLSMYRAGLLRAAEIISTGEYCRYVDHMQGACDCVEMADTIRKEAE